MCFTNDGNFGAFQGFSSQRWVLMWVWRVRSSPSVRQRRRDRSRKHRSLWPSHPASAYPRCLRITQQNRGRERDRVKPKLPKATLWLPPCRMWEKAESGGGDVERPLVSATAWSASCHQEVRATRGVLWKGIVGRWSHKFKCGTQTGMNCLIQSLKAVHSPSDGGHWVHSAGQWCQHTDWLILLHLQSSILVLNYSVFINCRWKNILK